MRTRSLIDGIDFRSIEVQFFVEIFQLTIHRKSKKYLEKMGSEPNSKIEHIRIAS